MGGMGYAAQLCKRERERETETEREKERERVEKGRKIKCLDKTKL